MRIHKRFVRWLLFADGLLTVALVAFVFIAHAEPVHALRWYLTASLGFAVIFLALNLAQNRGVLPGGIPIKPVRGIGEATRGSEFLTGGHDPTAETAAKERVMDDYLETARSLIRSERFEECADLLYKALESDAGNGRLLNTLGICLGRLMRYDEAVRAYQSSIEADYDNPGAHFNLAVALEHAERIPEAVLQYRRYLKIAQVLGEPSEMMARAEDRLRFLKGSAENR